MITAIAKDAFWSVVEECLLEFHGIPQSRATLLCDDLRREIEFPPTGMSSEIFYHADPFDVACDLADNHLDITPLRPRYDQILSRHNW
jgi:hypothetical protein